MKIRQMEALRAVVRTGTTKDGGRELLLTQSAVSKLISQLEDELSVSLFSRRGGRMILTPEGRMVLEDVERVLTIVDEMREKSRDTGALRAGKLRIGTMPALGHGLLPQALARLRSRFPNVTIVVEELSRARIEEQVSSGYFDVGLVTLPIHNDRVSAIELAEVSAVCVLPSGHRLAAKEIVEVSDLEDEHVISVDPDTLLRHRTDILFSEARVRRRLSVQTQTTLLACQLVRQSVGVAIVHPLIAMAFEQMLKVRPFRPSIPLKYAVIAQEGAHSQVAEAFIQNTIDVMADLAAQLPPPALHGTAKDR